MEFLCLIFYAFLRLRFLDVETNPGPRRPVPTVCRLVYSNVLGLAENISDLTVASSRYDILLRSETLVSDMGHVSELPVPGFGRPVALCRCKMPRARGMAAYVRERGRVDDLSFFEYLSSFCFLSIEFHCIFSISYKILPYFVY